MSKPDPHAQRLADLSSGEWPAFLGPHLRFCRALTSADLPHYRAARGICRWCGEAVAPPRRTWCSERCVDQFMVRTGGGVTRALVKLRDKGVCCECGQDWRELKAAWRSMLGGHRYHEVWLDRGNLLGVSMRWQAPEALHVLRRQFGDFDPERSLWEADHIVPVVLGGGCCDLSNLRTLCQRCHKLETRRLAATRAELRRAEQGRPVQRGLL